MSGTHMAKAERPEKGKGKVPPPAGKGEAEGGASEDRDTASVQIRKRLARMAKVVAAHEGISMCELLSPMIEPQLTARWRRAVGEMTEELDAD